ncbi:Hpt sensor hybrid histidine kinase [Desulfonatronospira thiodismutans ASO3-1]|uniref:histidine kinase n=1 Tax=Desulfonatronospira thiodismutans ASO3-1 TaxID=555779 RepID=D6SNI7_9BACT|nr:ATP-binding protein [Desulfonatronospira thiodismutans]EFI34313.1 Hpt sensor hybrid histidine kinase [Desulfonatronospira thiodismutans ASO3-1]
MTDHLEQRIRFLEEQVNYLTQEKRAAMQALELAASMSNFETSLNQVDTPDMILREAADRLKKLIAFKSLCFFLVDEQDSSFYPGYCEPQECLETISTEMQVLVDDKTFAWALGRNKPVVVTALSGDQLMLHAMKTSSRTRGIFFGVLDVEYKEVMDSIQMLATIIFMSVAGALESFELYRNIRQMNNQLTQSNAELRTAKEAALEASRAKSEFLANMSHELRTPISSIISGLKLLAPMEEDPQKLSILNTCKDSAEALHSIINDSLDLAKIEAGKIELIPENFDLHHELAKNLNTFRPQAGTKGLDLRLQMDPGLPRLVRADMHRLGQILRNLLSNAVKFTREGWVELGAEVLIKNEKSCGVNFWVQDTGIGIPKDVLPRLFEAYAQADGSYSKKYGGTGLGLAITRYLVRLMGGSISVHSKEGEGSCFTLNITFELPPEGQAEEVQDPDAEEQTPPEPLNILVAEDQDLPRMYVRHILEQAGHRVIEAHDGIQAVEEALNNPLDLVLMDIQMPGMDGIQASRRIRDALAPQKPAIIALTAYAMQTDRQNFLDAGMDDHLSKPVHPKLLLAKVNALAGSAAAESSLSSGNQDPLQDLQKNGPVNMDLVQEMFEDSRFWLHLVQLFTTQEQPAHIARLDEVLQARDAQRMKRLAHTLKGTMSTLCAERARDLAQSLEKNAGLENWAGIEQDCQALKEELQRMKTFAQKTDIQGDE